MENILFALFRHTVCGDVISEEIKSQITPEMVTALCELAYKHDMAHILSKALWELGVDAGDMTGLLRKNHMMAIYRYEKINSAFLAICQTLETAKIPFVPLKGSVIRDYYPEPWMRTSSDVDILVTEETLENAVSALTDTLKYTAKSKRDHDISLYSPGGVHLELHYKTVVESDGINKSYEVLSQIWDFATPKAPGSCQYVLTDAMFYFYHMAHMAKHLMVGGCGIRPFLDLWVLNRSVAYDKTQRQQLLRQGDLETFANAAEKLAEVWFSDAERDNLTEQLESFILRGGVYGNVENCVMVQQNKEGGKLQYILSKVFLPYDIIKFDYPVLQKHKWLTPVCQVARWFKLLFKGGVKRSVCKLQINASISREDANTTKTFLKHLGLH